MITFRAKGIIRNFLQAAKTAKANGDSKGGIVIDVSGAGIDIPEYERSTVTEIIGIIWEVSGENEYMFISDYDILLQQWHLIAEKPKPYTGTVEIPGYTKEEVN